MLATFATFATAVFALGLTAAAASDLLRRRVPNALNVAILVAGLGARAALGGLSGVGAGLAGAALGLVLLIVPFQARWIGGGDVKLLAAIGAWLGPMGVVWTALFGLAGGGLVAAAIALSGGRQLVAEVAGNVKASLYTLEAPHAPRRQRRYLVPLALPLAIAALGVLWATGGLHG